MSDPGQYHAIRPALQTLIDPLDVETFLSHYWRRAVLHLARDGVNPYESIVGVAELGRHLASYNLHAGFLRVVKDGIGHGVPRDTGGRWYTRARRLGPGPLVVQTRVVGGACRIADACRPGKGS